METPLRHSGIEVIGDVPWGTHFCQFYETSQDLIEILVPYFQEGLKGNEFCMWVTSEPLQADQAKAALQAAVPNLDRYIEKGQIEFIDHDQWYTRSGKFSADEVLQGWVDKLDAALERGYEGLRLTGNTFWLEPSNWNDFTKYAETVNNVIGKYRMLAVCTYSLRKCGAAEILDVLANHQFALVKRSGKWEIVESASHKKIEQALHESEARYRDLIDAAPDAILVHRDGKVLYANLAALELYGAASFEQLASHNILDLIHPDDLKGAIKRFEEAMSGQKLPIRAARIFDLKGKEIPIEVVITPIEYQGSKAIQAILRNISERKQAEDKLRQSEEQYRTLFSSMTEGFALHEIICNEKGEPIDYRFLDVNPAFERLTGLNRENVIGRTHNEILPDDDPRWVRDYGVVALEGEPAQFENYSTALKKHFEVFAYRPAPNQFAAMFIDITDRKEHETRIDKLSRLYSVLSQVNEAIVRTHDENLLLSDVCRIMAEVGGLPLVWIGDAKELEVIPFASHGPARDYLNKIKVELYGELSRGPTGTSILENRAVINDDFETNPATHPWHEQAQEYHFRSSAALPLHRHGNVFGALTLYSFEPNAFDAEQIELLESLASDISYALDAIEQEKLRFSAEQSLAETSNYLENLINHANAPIIVWDSSFRINRFNDAFERLTGYKAPEVLGKQLDMLFPEASKYESMNLIQSTLAGERWEAVEIPIIRKDGSTRMVLWNSANIINKDGKVISTIAQGQDITDRKKAEEELREARDELEQRVQERTVELLKAKENAEAAAEAKAAFMANMSHEIRTPMNSVIGMTSLLLDEDLTPDQRDFVETIRNGGEALLSIINDILDFSKLEQDKVELEYQSFDLQNTIEESLDLVASRAAEKRLNLAYFIEKSTPNRIIGDPTRLRQVLAILLDNAIKFTDKGEILLTVTSDRSDSKYELHFAVKDTGIGIDPAKMDKLFESFSQLDDSISIKYGGTGLGLAIGKRLVELMGGKIWAENNKGKGSTFQFTISTEAISSKPASEIDPRLKGKRILIVEDNKTIRRILGHVTRDWGMMPTTAGSSHDALKLIRGEDSFDIAIIEKDLDEMDGLGLAREIRRNNKTIPLLMLTFLGQGVESDLFAVTITKPIKQSQIHKTLINTLAPPIIPSAISEPETKPASEAMRILLAEDNVSSQKVTLRMLHKLGYRADVVANGLEVLEALGRQQYDLILMDVRMPEMSGLEASKVIRQRWPGKKPLIIAITAYGLQGDRERCLDAGMDDYLSKPVQLEDLAEMLQKYASPHTDIKMASKGRKKRQ
jgi:PAS domain S-box-containing protein